VSRFLDVEAVVSDEEDDEDEEEDDTAGWLSPGLPYPNDC